MICNKDGVDLFRAGVFRIETEYVISLCECIFIQDYSFLTIDIFTIIESHYTRYGYICKSNAR